MTGHSSTQSKRAAGLITQSKSIDKRKHLQSFNRANPYKFQIDLTSKKLVESN